MPKPRPLGTSETRYALYQSLEKAVRKSYPQISSRKQQVKTNAMWNKGIMTQDHYDRLLQELEERVLAKERMQQTFETEKEFAAALRSRAESNSIKELAFLMKRHPYADLNESDEKGSTALHYACRNNNLDMIRLLGRRGDWNVQDVNGCTPMHLSCLFSSSEAIRTGLKCGGDPNIFTNEGLHPLHISARRNDFETFRILVEEGADLDALNAQHETALDICEREDFGDLIRFITSVDHSVFAKNSTASAIPQLPSMQKYRSFYELAHREPSTRDSGGYDQIGDDLEDEPSEQHHIRIIKETWAHVEDSAEEFGGLLYEMLMNMNIEMTSLFNDTEFATQKTAFVNMMGRAVQWLHDDFRTWERKMAPLAQRHVRYGVKPEHYQYFRKAFLRTMRSFFDTWSEEQETAWVWYWSCIMNTLGFATQSSLFETEYVSPAQRAVHVFALYELWRGISEDPIRFGELFYQKIAEKNQQVFELFSSTSMMSQGIKLFAMLSHAIKQVEDSGTFENDLIRLTYQHKVYGVKMEHVDVFGSAFAESVEQMLGDAYTDEGRVAIVWFWGCVRDCFEYGLEHTHHLAELSKEEEERAALLKEVMATIEEIDEGAGPAMIAAGRSLGGADLLMDISTARIFQPTRKLRGL